MDLLIGRYAHVIDDKARLTIPSKIRNKLGETVYVSKGFEGCLEVRTPQEFERYTRDLLVYKSTDARSRMLNREIFANTEEVEIDSAGRIHLSSQQLKLANLTKDVYIIGVINHLEIWDRSQFDKYEEENEPHFEDAASQLGNSHE